MPNDMLRTTDLDRNDTTQYRHVGLILVITGTTFSCRSI